MKKGMIFILMSFLVILFSCETETAADLVPEKFIRSHTDTAPLTALGLRSPALLLVVKNVGDEESVPCKTKVECPFSSFKPCIVNTPAIQAGSEVKIQLTPPGGIVSDYPEYIVTVDSEDVVYEKDETNNRESLDF